MRLDTQRAQGIDAWAHLRRSCTRAQALQAAVGYPARVVVGRQGRPGSGSVGLVVAHKSRPAQVGCGVVDAVAAAGALLLP
jgi:hypothetical protein